jgi:PEGA domain
MTRNLVSCALVPLLSISLVAQQTPQIPAPAVPPTNATEPAPSQPAPAQSLTNDHTLMDGTAVRLRTSQTISSADARVGDQVPFEVLENISVSGVVVIKKGTTAVGNVTEAEAKKSMGRGGKLNVSLSYVRLVDQEKVALRATKQSKGGGHIGAMTTGMVATAVVFLPAVPLFLFIHGKDTTIPQGTEVTAFVEGDMTLSMANFVASPAAIEAGAVNSNVAAPIQASLAFDSTPPGADIEIDGAFAGNTPSTVNIAAGSHQIALKKKGFTDWIKTLNITGGTVRLNAELEKEPAQ